MLTDILGHRRERRGAMLGVPAGRRWRLRYRWPRPSLEFQMRLSLPAIALSVCFSPLGLAASGASGDVAKTASPKTVPATALPPSAPTPDAAASDAAARHAKRTACLKQAKS